MPNPMKSIRKEIRVPLSQERAFNLFINDFSAWWPSAYTWSQDSLVKVIIEPKKDGRCYEIGPHDFQCQFSHVLSFNPPNNIAFTWQIGPQGQPQPNPENASEIYVSFVYEEKVLTKIIFEHTFIERHGGKNIEKYYDALNSQQGWSWVLENYEKKAKAIV